MSVHFHIRWNDNGIDWMAHPTREDAEATAKGISRPSEAYTIESFADDNCLRCKLFREEASRPGLIRAQDTNPAFKKRPLVA